MASEGEIKERFRQLGPWLDERTRRLWAAAESAAHGRGGPSLVARASVSRRAIAVGLEELPKKPDRSRRSRLPVRQKGGGRKKTSLKDPICCAIWKDCWSQSREEIHSRLCDGHVKAYGISLANCGPAGTR